ncbi:helix-turn-helix transcriptional regulator [Saccharibacillus sp. CPCC 101409]|uniref:helix-turn-helix transcriptional regulator n=1 Tax=Saccharibacillus sp. CPCC 101409 TaxID=3058041 RepID=UPI0026722B68|nr:helix-turn-helix transcriptional regulator [Saccharibacillus sp. CPCC 101409]MDO3411793.1 helix-turn-helix transcriptional regulator [Saccharibacillus sp. CPCC 101409]
MMIKHFLRKTYIRTFLLLTGVLICCVLPFVYFISAEFAKYTLVEVRGNSQNEVDNLSAKAEIILGNLKAYGLSMYADQNIQNWFFNTQKDPLVDHAALAAQSNFLSTEPLIQRSYLINLKQGLVVDSKAGIVDFDAFADRAMLKRVQAFNHRYLHFFRHALNGSESLALVLPATPEKASDFYLVLLIDKPLLSSLLLGDSVPEERDIRILDENGQALLGEADAELSKRLYEAGLERQGRGFEVRLPQQRWFVNTAGMAAENWTIYYSTEYRTLTRSILLLQQKMIAYTILLLGILSVLFFLSSRHSLRSITFLSEKLKGKVGAGSPVSDLKPDIQWINDGIETLLDNVEQLHASARNQSELVRMEFLARWVLHGTPDSKSRDYIRSRTRLASCDTLFLAVLRLEAYPVFCERYDFPSRKLIKYAIRNISEEVIGAGPYAVEGLDMGGDHLILLIGGGRSGELQLRRLLEEVLGQTMRILNIELTAAVSGAYDPGANIRSVYDHIYELTMLRFLNGERQIFLENDYEEFMADYPAASEALDTVDIIQAIRGGRIEAALALLRRQMEHIHGMPYRDCKLYLTYFTYDLLKSFNKSSALHEIGGIRQQLDRYRTLSEYQTWLEEVVSTLASETDVPGSLSRKEELVLEIREYADSHLQDAQLSIEQIADNFSFSVSYIRQLFKEIMNVSLSEYILRERIERVKERLVSSRLSVLEIADQCGFLSKGHFFATFKKFTNLTPKQYREMHGDREISG